GPPLFFSLLIITVSFLPVFTLEAQEGKMFAPLAFTKTYAMAAAALLSITLIPVLMGYLIRGNILPEKKNPLNRATTALYRPLINFVMTYPKAVLLFTAALSLSGLFSAEKLGSEFMPPLDEGDLMYMPTTYPGISIGKARQLLQQTDKLIATLPEVKTVYGKIGRAETATDPAPLTMIETVIQFKARDQWRPGMTPEKIKQELNQLITLPGVTNAWVMPIKTRIDMLATGIKTPIGIKISGPKLKEIEQIGRQIEQLIKPLQGTTSVYSERVAGGRYIKVDVNRDSAARYGLNIADVQEVVRTAIGGMNVTYTVEGLERYPVNIRYPQSFRDSVEQLKLLPVVTPAGARLALADVANIYVDDGPPAIKSENARPNGWVFIDISKRDLGSYVHEAQALLNDRLNLPNGYSITWSGQYEYMVRAQERLTVVIPVTLMIILLLLYLNFRSLPEVLIIMGTLPLAWIGGVWLMLLLDYDFSVAVGVGFIALAGVSVEIGVIMLIYLNQAYAQVTLAAQEEKRPLKVSDIKHAIILGAGQRVRPIMMTVSTVIAGLVPIMFSDGTGAEVMHRIAAPMIGGMFSAVILTLMVIPAVFLIWKSRGLRDN
ncbi:MAG: efflux RND transporter permease subunit, partial [Gammaproteobacteria bacterium]|nr:efflux RND transporter permease subunit [Gammaproteobacteria bacterium]